MQDYRYLVRFVDEGDGNILVSVPDVPEVLTWGGDLREARRMAGEALGLALRACYLASNKPLPEAVHRGEPMMAPQLDDLLKIILVGRFRASGMTVEDLRDRIGIKDWKAAALVDPDTVNDIGDMEDALAVLGWRLDVQIERHEVCLSAAANEQCETGGTAP